MGPDQRTKRAGLGPDDFDYELPADRIAHQPIEPRDAARLLVAPASGTVLHQHITDLPDLLQDGDLLVVNDTRVLPARVIFQKDTGGKVEILLLDARDDGQWECLVRPSKRTPPGTRVRAGDDFAAVVGEDLGEGRRLIQFETDHDLLVALDAHGQMPLPPYLNTVLDDPERYQTVYSERPASAAAPTAGLHLTDEVLAQLAAKNIELARVELVVGLDTFRPLSAASLDEHIMHTESYNVSAETWDKVSAAKRVVAVGTTSVRALESAASRHELFGRTDIFIRAPYDFSVVDVMLTNFHLPKSSLLVMIDAFVGPKWRDIYRTAIEEKYRFLSFGDAMLLERSQ
ncbi:MAG: tRNA preQ1(34) S-adenosylmethionine ribosyltransferase-isomerase QueA [Acidimicrobiales bacterium]